MDSTEYVMNRMKYETCGYIREKRSKSLFLNHLLADRTPSIIHPTKEFLRILRFLREIKICKI
jgi:hypothetical protein